MSKAILAWHFLDKKDMSDMSTYIKELGNEGMKDPLGLSILRDYFSNQMFPATTVQHTRIKYYFYVAEELYKFCNGGYDDFTKMEESLRTRLFSERGISGNIKSEDKKNVAGIIGNSQVEIPVIPPRSIYFSALKKLQIIKNEKLNEFISFNKQSRSLKDNNLKDDEGVVLNFVEKPEKLLRAEIDECFCPIFLKSFLNSSFKTWELTDAEAEYIISKHQLLSDDNEYEHLMLKLIKKTKDEVPKEFYKLKINDDTYKTACLVSCLASGMYHFFNLGLLEARTTDDHLPEEVIRIDDCKEWRDHFIEKHPQIPVKDLAKIKEIILDKYKPSRRLEFLFPQFIDIIYDSSWINRVDEITVILRTREETYKRTKSKFKYPHNIEPKNDYICPNSNYHYNYRWWKVVDHLRDLKRIKDTQ